MDFIDIIIRLLTPMEGVDYAIAPLLLAALTAAPGIISGVSAANAAGDQARRAMDRAKKDRTRASNDLERLKSGVLEFEPEKFKFSEKNLEAYDIAQSRAPEMAAQRALEQSLATSANAASVDPRLAAMTAQSTAGNVANLAQQQAIASLGRRQSAATTLGAVQDATSDANVRARQTQMDTEVSRAQGQFDAARSARRAAQDAKQEARRQRNQAFIQGGSNIINTGMAMQGQDPSFAGLFTGEIDQTQNPFYTPPPKETAKGGKLSYGHGGEVMETEGEFNHSTNKKALVDEESGVKEAELTGGELVFNPDQTQMMEELISSGDSKRLMAFLKDLMSQPQFQA
tara:strand:- start:3101 stop:4129 length:1029 start_codon:yes stop_codon:yes gene_type:complete